MDICNDFIFVEE